MKCTLNQVFRSQFYVMRCIKLLCDAVIQILNILMFFCDLHYLCLQIFWQHDEDPPLEARRHGTWDWCPSLTTRRCCNFIVSGLWVAMNKSYFICILHFMWDCWNSNPRFLLFASFKCLLHIGIFLGQFFIDAFNNQKCVDATRMPPRGLQS